MKLGMPFRKKWQPQLPIIGLEIGLENKGIDIVQVGITDWKSAAWYWLWIGVKTFS